MIGISVLLTGCTSQDSPAPVGLSVYQRVTGDDSREDRVLWDSVYDSKDYIFGKEPSPFIVEVVRQLPRKGNVLDLGAGEGRNAVYLAQHGLRVDAVDISEVALRKAQRLARERRATIRTVVADLRKYTIRPSQYDVIVCVDYVDRNLVKAIREGLKPGGLIVYEAPLSERSADGVLSGELKNLFGAGFEILIDRELPNGDRPVTRFMARRT